MITEQVYINISAGLPSDGIFYIVEKVKSPIAKSNDVWYRCIGCGDQKEYILPLCFLQQHGELVERHFS